MPATTSTSTRTKAKAKASPRAKPRATTSDTPDAVQLLKADHKEVKQLFKAYEKLAQDDAADSEEKQRLAERICSLLTVHATIEEEIFYPAARDALDDEADLVDEATVEHASAKDLIAQLQSSSPDDDLYDAKVKVLGEYIDHHVKEEEEEMFPKAKKAKLDLEALGQELQERKQALMEEMGLEEEAVAS